MRIGVDTGGTFTDCVVQDGGEIKILKVFSAPDAAAAILEGVRRLVAERVPRRSADIIHGTTLGTNSLLERRGARVALVTTSGFEDLIEIGRQARPRLYDLNVQREPPLVPRALRFGVKERIAADGRPLLRPTPTELRRVRLQVKRSGAESIALCFLFSFANPAHEQVVARALRTLGLPVAASHEILPEFREYERLSTTVINAYLAPRMGEYLTRLERAAGEGLGGPPLSPPSPRAGRGRLFVMQSSGGITTAARAAAEPVRTILSGPAGGVVAATWLAESLGVRHAISFDMGGTSTDACLIDGRARTTHETTLGGLPVAIPMLDVHSVGTGGGSKARFDRGGALRVGPESAGATPGPICYGRGGTEPTVTDAHLLLGRIDPDYFLGGTFQLDLRAAQERFAECLACQPQATGLKTPIGLARGIVAVCNATMEKALRVISVERGYDPRDFSLVSFGGAGGLHAADLVRSLRLARVIIPQNPGAFSALGILLSDIIRDVSKSVLLPVPDVPRAAASRGFFESLRRELERLETAARAELRREGFPAESARVERRLDVRYVGQSYELSVPFNAHFPNAFHREHEKVYGHAQPGRPLEIVNLRTRLSIRTPKPRLPHRKAGTSPGLRAALAKQKPVWFGRRFWRTPFYHRNGLPSGAKLAGPAVIVEYSSTTVVPPDFICRVDEYLNLVLSPQEA
jgi:N-methylhydantoinase A